MEALVALGLVSNVIQFVDFGIRATSKCRQIYKEGAAIEHQDLIHTAATLAKVAGRIQEFYSQCQANSSLGESEVQLLALAKRCIDTADVLQSELRKLSTPSKHGLRASLKKTFSSMRRASTIDELNEQLERERRLLDTTLLASLHDLTHHAMTLSQDLGKRLEDTERAIVAKLASGVTSIDLLVADDGERTRKEVRDEGLATRECITQRLQDLSTTTSSEMTRKALLDSLHFPEINLRQEQIKPAFAKTFEFIFDDSGLALRPWSNFVKWLRSDVDSVYWVQGKAGSGKSTLVSFLAEDPRTLENAFVGRRCDAHPILITFFFWNAGSELQRTAEGLLRSILYQLLASDKTLFDRIISENTTLQQRNPRTAWSVKVLSSLLKEAIVHLQEYACILLDGLDEFDENIQVLLDIVDLLRGARAVKLCISSRPLRRLETAFEGCDELKLQDLTRSGIRTFVEGALLNSTDFRTFQARQGPSSENERSELIENILDKANGIFLWVSLVISDLLDGVDNLDDWDILLQRLNDIPEDIEKIYHKMWNKVQRQNPAYKRDAVESFRHILDGEMSLLEFVIATDTGLQTLYLEEEGCVSYEALVEKCHRRRVHLFARCMGLLEVSSTKSTYYREHHNEPLGEPIADATHTDPLIYDLLRRQHNDNAIGFVHRTAVDYVRSRLGFGESLDRPLPLGHSQDSTDTRVRCRCVLWKLDLNALDQVSIGNELRILHGWGRRQLSAAAYKVARTTYDSFSQNDEVFYSSSSCPVALDFPGMVIYEGYYPKSVGDLVDIADHTPDYLGYLLLCACGSTDGFGDRESGSRMARLICELLSGGANPMKDFTPPDRQHKDWPTLRQFYVPWWLFMQRLLWYSFWFGSEYTGSLEEATEALLRAGVDVDGVVLFHVVFDQLFRLGCPDPEARFDGPEEIVLSGSPQSFFQHLRLAGFWGDVHGRCHPGLVSNPGDHLRILLFRLDGRWIRLRTESDSDIVLAYSATAAGSLHQEHQVDRFVRLLSCKKSLFGRLSPQTQANFEDVVRRSLHITRDTSYDDWKLPSSIATTIVTAQFARSIRTQIDPIFSPSVDEHSSVGNLEKLLRRIMFGEHL